ncbi:putative pyruvate formate lyase activating enzyme [Eubacterium sp. CAG:252]|nr:putative pyruvate formate lyase activating enzyme [Eubacterium sp. CAG:252]
MIRNNENTDNNGCNLCPRMCNVNRHTGTGYCLMTDRLKVARAALHMWEEPCISGERGSGAVFFSGCTLRCVFCQNYKIAAAKVGKYITVDELADIMLRLQNNQANNINLVTPTHYAGQIAEALIKAKDRGLKIPVVYNTSAYENVDTLKIMDGLVDVYLPDFKYMDGKLALKYSNAGNYPETAKAALREMVRQTGTPDMYGDDDTLVRDGYVESGIMKKGVIVRHLILPGYTKESRNVIKYLYDTYKNDIYISIMNQYTPLEHVKLYKELCRKVTKKEYDKVVDYAIDIGVTNAFIQEGGTAKESFIPEFDFTGL